MDYGDAKLTSVTPGILMIAIPFPHEPPTAYGEIDTMRGTIEDERRAA